MVALWVFACASSTERKRKSSLFCPTIRPTWSARILRRATSIVAWRVRRWPTPRLLRCTEPLRPGKTSFTTWSARSRACALRSLLTLVPLSAGSTQQGDCPWHRHAPKKFLCGGEAPPHLPFQVRPPVEGKSDRRGPRPCC